MVSVLVYIVPVARNKARQPEGKNTTRETIMKAETKEITVLKNTVAVARRLGVSRSHLYRVIHGERKSSRLAARLRRMGISVAE